LFQGGSKERGGVVLNVGGYGRQIPEYEFITSILKKLKKPPYKGDSYERYF